MLLSILIFLTMRLHETIINHTLDMIAPIDADLLKSEQESIEGLTYDSPFDKYFRGAKEWERILDTIGKDDLSIVDQLQIDAIKL